MKIPALLAAVLFVGSLLAAPGNAQGRVDLIVVVDNSGSMDLEANEVQNSLNSFAQALQGAGVSLRLILISDDSTDDEGICVPAPLGSGACPADENLPDFRHVVVSVNSGDAFNTILGSYASWSGSLRTNARKVLIVVTDDDDDLSAEDFESQLLALDPSFQGFRFHAIVAGEFDVMSDPCALVAASPGRAYTELARRTRGRSYDLCLQTFGPYFLDVATQIFEQSKGARFRRGDQDGDGFTVFQGDCQDWPSPRVPRPDRVNPGAYEVAGNGIDDDCNGVVDDAPPSTCSTATNLSPTASELAAALDLCQTTTAAKGPWGLISAELLLADGSGTPAALQSSVKSGFGDSYAPMVGSTLAVLSTGVARDQADPGYVAPGPCDVGGGGTDNGTSAPMPAAWLAANGGNPVGAPGCPSPNIIANDPIQLRLRLRVPTNATTLRFQFAFLSSEWPDTCTQFNDTALALVTEGAHPSVPFDGNVMLASGGLPVTVQTVPFDVCLFCPSGSSMLSGTGFTFDNDAATSWNQAVFSVIPGAEMTLEFHLWDADDHGCDSTLLLDGLQFDLLP